MPRVKETDFEILTRNYSHTKNLNPENINNLILYFIEKNESYDRNYTIKHYNDFMENYKSLENSLKKLRKFEFDKRINLIKKILRILYSLYLFIEKDKYEFCDDLYYYFLLLSDCYKDYQYDSVVFNNINPIDASYYVGCYFKHQKITNYF